MSGIIKLNYYNGNRPQNLRNVPVIYPSIFWIEKGNKQLQWQNDWIQFNSHNWLLAHGHKSLTFINNPDKTHFFSTQLSFLIHPTDEQIQRSQENQKESLTPEYRIDKTAQYLWQSIITMPKNIEPNANHTIESVCDHFGLSKSTLMRRLKDENTQFRDVLAELRMGYALSLLQTKPYSQIELAHLCGYKSEARFAQRFQHQFGLSLKQYQKTFESY